MGAFRPGTAAVVITTSCSRRTRGEQLSLPLVKSFVHRLRVAALPFGGFDIEHDELRPQTLDLLLDRGAHVVGRNHRTQAPCRRDRLQARDARAQHQNLRGRDRARRRHHHGKHFRQRRRSDQHGFVTRDAGHRGKRIHGLRARDARHQFHGEERNPAVGQFRALAQRGQRLAETDQYLAGSQRGEIIASAFRIRARSAGLHDDPGFPKNVFARGQTHAATGVFFVGKSGCKPGRRLDNYFKLQLDQGFTGARRQCDAALAPERLARDTDDKRYETPP